MASLSPDLCKIHLFAHPWLYTALTFELNQSISTIKLINKIFCTYFNLFSFICVLPLIQSLVITGSSVTSLSITVWNRTTLGAAPICLLSSPAQVLTAWGRRRWGWTGAGRSPRGYMSLSGQGREMITMKRRRRVGGRDAKRQLFYTSKVWAKIILPKKVQ